MRKIIALLGRASIIIFILALTIFVSAISLGIWLSSFAWFKKSWLDTKIFQPLVLFIFQTNVLDFSAVYYRWGGHSKYGWEDGKSRVYGFWKSVSWVLSTFWIGYCCGISQQRASISTLQYSALHRHPFSHLVSSKGHGICMLLLDVQFIIFISCGTSPSCPTTLDLKTRPWSKTSVSSPIEHNNMKCQVYFLHYPYAL